MKTKNSREQDQRITRELDNYRLAPPSPDLHDRVLRAAHEVLANSDATLHWTDRWLRACMAFRQEILAYASVLLLVLGVVMQLGGGPSVLADSMERLAVMAAVSGSLSRATSMDCAVLKRNAGEETIGYRVCWNASGITRIDMDSAKDARRMMWISKETASVVDNNGEVRSMAISALPPEWQPPTEFLTPSILAQRMEGYGLKQADRQSDAQPGELLFVGHEDQQAIEMSLDAKTGLPIKLNKYLPDSSRTGKKRDCLEEVRFQWNRPIPQELFVPDSPEVRQQDY
ncbi:MAG TPA: hypothetical protein VMG30_04300 [Acidobacteriota bacterium]|nr:hypothetical protein [Acidobacteriota bacterium]